MPVRLGISSGIRMPTANRQLASATGSLRRPILSVIGPAVSAAISETTSVITPITAINAFAESLAFDWPAKM